MVLLIGIKLTLLQKGLRSATVLIVMTHSVMLLSLLLSVLFCLLLCNRAGVFVSWMYRICSSMTF
jgi:hypothetical protein